MRILVTGANGYLGQGIVKAIIESGNKVIATDFKLDNVDTRATKIECDIFSIEDPYEYFEKAKYNEFNFQPLKGEKMNEIYEKSRCVLDSAQDGQIGLTIRVIEALGAKKKLITTNEDIVNYDFYCPENIYLYNGKFDLDNIFFKSKYKRIDNVIYERYSLRNWLKEVIG